MLKYIVFFLLFLTLLPARSQNNAGARASAMGGASLCLADVWSCENNQAGLARLKGLVFGASYENRFLLRPLSTSSVVCALPTKKGCFGFSYKGFGYSAYKETKLGLGYGMALSEIFSFGLQFNYIHLQLMDVYGKAQTLSAEIGFQGRLSKKLNVAGHLYNPNRAKLTTYNNETIPIQLNLGLQYIFSDYVVVLLDAEKATYTALNIKSGLEYRPAKDICIRAGASSVPLQLSFGAGVCKKKLNIDISSSYHTVLGFSPQIALSYKLSRQGLLPANKPK